MSDQANPRSIGCISERPAGPIEMKIKALGRRLAGVHETIKPLDAIDCWPLVQGRTIAANVPSRICSSGETFHQCTLGSHRMNYCGIHSHFFTAHLIFEIPVRVRGQAVAELSRPISRPNAVGGFKIINFLIVDEVTNIRERWLFGKVDQMHFISGEIKKCHSLVIKCLHRFFSDDPKTRIAVVNLL